MIDLKVNRRLINSLFNGYKLANEQLHTTSVDVPAIDEGAKNSSHFSYAYSKATQLHNHLYKNPWDNSIYFIDQDLNIQRVTHTKDTDCCDINTVFRLPLNERTCDRVSGSLIFPLERLVILNDGIGKIYLLKIGNVGSESQQWSTVGNEPIFDTNEQGFLTFAKIHNNILHVVIVSLKDSLISDTSEVLVQWIQFSCSNFDVLENLKMETSYSFLGKGLPNLCWLEKDYTKLFILCDKEFQQVDSATLAPISPSVQPQQEQFNGHIKRYKWHQSKELLVINYDNSIVTEDQVSCAFSHDSICLKIDQSNVIIEGKLEKEILVEPSRWFLQDGRLEVVLIKKEPGIFWTTLVPGDVYGEHEIDGEEAAKMGEVHQSLAHLTSSNDNDMEDNEDPNLFNMEQLEECDQNLENEISLFVQDVKTKDSAKLASLGSRQLIFSSSESNEVAPLLCIRDGVDGIVWQTSASVEENWKHVTTFDAFGYVLASKQQHKFVNCTPNFSHVFIIDCVSHLYVYEGRQGSQSTHKQYVISLDTDSYSILGYEVTNDRLYILTNKKLYVITLKN